MIVVPADFTSKQMSAASANPEASQIKLYINQGSFRMLSTMIETAMKNMISQMSDADPGSDEMDRIWRAGAGGWFNSSTVIMIVLAAVGICLSYLSLVRKGNEEW